jgi:hypothetical protein
MMRRNDGVKGVGFHGQSSVGESFRSCYIEKSKFL